MDVRKLVLFMAWMTAIGFMSWAGWQLIQRAPKGGPF